MKGTIMQQIRNENPIENEKIGRFICLVSPMVTGSLKRLLQAVGFQVKQKGSNLNTELIIQKGEKKAEMYLRNLLLEIATIDRDEEPLRFDERLQDFDFFAAKTVQLTQSKLKILFHLFAEEDMNAVIENISRDAKDYERIRIWQFDQKNQTSQEKRC
jgi:hypothetical protein